ncbi:MAG: UDP-glucose 4-epimerase GalE [Deltaproteobacteria bacterium]|nr:MAG: UDP-glucose 4-epimerase GalE [Deltaproteobacteria bacterium]
MSTILITGGAGYIGSHVVKELVKKGHHPVVYDNLQTGHRKAIRDVPFIQGDLKDEEKLKQAFRSHPIQSVMHFAGDCLVGESVREPVKYFNNNVKNSLQLIEMMDYLNIKYIVFSSSAAVYGEPEEVPIRENHPCQPMNPYGETKWIFERVLHAFHQAGKIDFVSLRYFNAAGADPAAETGEDHSYETHLIPIGILAALNEGLVSIFGTDYETPDGTCVRDYVHVTDLAQAHILALERLESGGGSAIYNLGNGNGYSVREVIETIKKVTRKRIPTIEGARRPGDPARLVASSEKIRNELGWRPRYPDLETIVGTAWEWHRSHPKGYDDKS